jgi:hypothetical protein
MYEKDKIIQWHVWTKFKHKRNPYVMDGFYHEDSWFSSKQAAEDYAESLFGIEEWEVKELTLTAEEAQQDENVRQIMAHWKAVYEDEEDSSDRIQ